VNVEIKICGLTNKEDSMFSLQAGADYLGFVIYSKSPRCITPSALSSLAGKLPPSARLVGVFVNTPRSEIERIAAETPLFAVQLHGDEKADEFQDFPFPLWRSWRPDMETPLSSGAASWQADRYVLDTAAGPPYGGTGKISDWTAAARIAGRHRIMLAGGLNRDNVAAAIAVVRPAGVDVSSGVEEKPGIKNHAAITAFINAARTAK
jgi:phosphoribosylanthranilate isomerase